MLTLAMAVLLASLVGSLHCVGMCGPFALWATQGGRSHVTIASYHLGRLTTYLSAGLAAGLLGSAVAIGGDLAGLQSFAAKLAGGLLIFLGLSRLLLLLPVFRPPAAVAAEAITDRGIAPAGQAVHRQSWSRRARLPCGPADHMAPLRLALLVCPGRCRNRRCDSRIDRDDRVLVGDFAGADRPHTRCPSLIPRFRRALPIAASTLVDRDGALHGHRACLGGSLRDGATCSGPDPDR